VLKFHHAIPNLFHLKEVTSQISCSNNWKTYKYPSFWLNKFSITFFQCSLLKYTFKIIKFMFIKMFTIWQFARLQTFINIFNKIKIFFLVPFESYPIFLVVIMALLTTLLNTSWEWNNIKNKIKLSHNAIWNSIVTPHLQSQSLLIVIIHEIFFITN